MKKTSYSFVKWAGGKSQLIEQLENFFPEKIERYFEPFVGGGAVFFYVVQKYKPKYVFLSDVNEELVNAYSVIRDDVRPLITLLKKHKKNHSKEYYYKIRSVDVNSLNTMEKAARFIYLNRTCFNGLYRVNSKGLFNVPIGKYTNPNIVQEIKLLHISEVLKNVKVEVMSFEKVVPKTKKGDFVYLDPPYYPLEKTSFTTYTKDKFLKEKQLKLKEVCNKLDKKECLFMQSNSYTKFIRKLYSRYTIKTVLAKRRINSKASGRGEIKEIVILNY